MMRGRPIQSPYGPKLYGNAVAVGGGGRRALRLRQSHLISISIAIIGATKYEEQIIVLG